MKLYTNTYSLRLLPLSLLATVAVIVVIGLVSTGCRRTPDTTLRTLDHIQEIIEKHPDSALSLIKSIDTMTLRGAADRARYSMLRTMALDKNNVNITDMSILNPAIEYYISHGNPDERLMTRYYKGRILMNRGDKEAALTEFLKASEDSASCTDRMALARLLVAQGRMYWDEARFKDYMECNRRASEIYREEGDSIRYYRSLGRMLDGSLGNMDSISRGRLLKKCIHGLYEYGNRIIALPVYIAIAFPDLLPRDEFDNFVRKIEEDSISSPTLQTAIACAYSEYGDFEKARIYIEGGDRNDSTFYFSNLSGILEKSGDRQGALDAYKTYLVAQENSLMELFQGDLLFTRERYELEKEAMHNISRRERIIYISVSGIIILLLSSFIIYLLYRSNRTKRIEAESENSVLRSDNQQLEHTNTGLEKDKKALTDNIKKLEEDLNEYIHNLQMEQDRLQDVQDEKAHLEERMRYIIETRFKLVNGLLAAEISSPNEYSKIYKKLLHSANKNKKEFLKNMKESYELSHPEFMKTLRGYNLTEREENICCLFTLGLSGKEIGFYLEIKNIYNITASIRAKIAGFPTNDELNEYIKRLFDSY